MAILRAEVDDDDALVNGLVFRIKTGFKLSFFGCGLDFRPRTLLAPGDFQVGRHFQVVAGGDPPSTGKLFLDRGGTSLELINRSD